MLDYQKEPFVPKKMRVRYRREPLGLVLFFFLLAAMSSQAQEMTGAFEISFEKEPLWISSGIWTSKGDRVYLVDNLGREIVQVDVDKRDILRPFEPLGGRKSARFNVLTRAKDRLFLDFYIPSSDSKPSSHSIAPLDGQLVPDLTESIHIVGNNDPKTPGRSQEGKIKRLISWATDEQYIYAFVQIEQAGTPPWISSFVKIPYGDPSRFEYFLDLKLSIGDPLSTFYQLGLNMIEATPQGVYILVMDEIPYLAFQKRNGPIQTLDIKDVCGVRPQLAPLREGVSAVLQALERSEGPMGLFSIDSRLYLLCRRIDNKVTKFYLAGIDIATGKAESRFRIPTDAAHLTVVPGADYWAFVQKGAVQMMPEGPYTPTRKVLFVPSDKIDGTARVADLDEQLYQNKPETISEWLTQSEWGPLVGFLFGGVGLAVLGAALKLLFMKRA